MRGRVWAIGIAITIAALITDTSVRADWPMARHDPQRTGMTTGASNITSPVAYWKYYLGGSIASNDVRYLELDGAPAAVMVSVGRVVAKRFSDDTIWRTPPLAITNMVGLGDLDGDGTQELVAHSKDHVYIVDLATGAILWEEPDGQMGTIGGVRMADLDGDSTDDLVIHECWCCSVRSGETGFVYSFANGFASPTLMWEFPWTTCGAGKRFTIADVRGLGRYDVLLPTDDAVSLLDGATGAVIATTGSLGAGAPWLQCVPANVDGMAGDELICYMNTGLATVDRLVLALGYSALPSPSFGVLWSQSVAPVVGGNVRFSHPLADLDGDGTLEVIASGRDASGLWTTYVFDALSGGVLDTLPGHIAHGAIALENTGQKLLITTTGSDLSAWSFDPAQPAPLASRWTLNDRDVFIHQDPDLVKLSNASGRLLTADVDGDGIDDLLTHKISEGAQLVAYSGVTGQPVVAASYPFLVEVKQLAVWKLPDDLSTKIAFAVASDDGFLKFFDETLRPSTFGDDISSRGIRVGGYYASGGWRDLRTTPVTGVLGNDTYSSIVVPDSQQALRRLDASVGTFAAPPTTTWRLTHSFAPVIVPNLDGSDTGIACMAIQEPVTDPPQYTLRAHSADGQQLWTTPLPQQPLNDFLPGVFNADAVPDFVFQWGAPGDTLLRTRAISGADGSTIWDSTPVEPGAGRQPAGFAAGRWDQDNLDDVVYQGKGTRVLSGANGSEIAFSGTGPNYFMPTLLDVTGGSELEVSLHGGIEPARTLSHDLGAVVWQSSESDRPLPYAAFASCPDGRNVMVEGSWTFPARLKVTVTGGANAGQAQTVVLAGGQTYVDEDAADAAGKWQGQLTSATIHTDLTGEGRPSALVGSSDGFLYAINPCDLSLDFAYDIGSPVGEAVFGDTNGDGKDDILVTAQDGYLYDLRQFVIDAPGYVWDLDPQGGVDDVNSIVNSGVLSARWEAVPGASSYQIAVVDIDRRYVTSPPWIDVGMVTAYTIPLALTDNATYFFAVRAVAPGGPSVDTVSDGLVVLPAGGGDGGPGNDAGNPGSPGGGCCSAQQSAPTPPLATVLLAVLALGITLRRRRCR